ncbi:MAG: peptide chain release factor N(5)-glutamine methyltransferase [Candidatus Magasanikbacteria bacterium]
MQKTIQQVLTKAEKDISLLDAEVLLAFVLQKERMYIKTHIENTIPLMKQLTYTFLVQKRKKGIPVAHIIKEKEFFGIPFYVNKNVLVPRPETEIIVEIIKDKITKENKKITLLDIGTGSGCIPLSLAKTFLNKKNIQYFASDISPKALCVAKRNKQNLNVPVTFFQSDLLENIPQKIKEQILQSESIYITANLPYITEKQFAKETSIQHEPKLALVAEDDGLALYKKFLQQLKPLIKEIQIPLTVLLEIDPDQTEKIKRYIHEIFPEANIQIHKDYCGHERIIEMTL